MFVRDLEQKAEHGVVDLQRQPGPGHAECRVVGYRLAIRQAQKAMPRQGISAPPGDLALGTQTFELADEQHAEVAAWRDRRAANAVLVVPLAQHLDRFVELGLGQYLIAPVVKRVPGCQVHGQPAPTTRPGSHYEARLPLRGAVRRLLSRPIAMLSRLELHHTNVHRFGTSAVCQRTVRRLKFPLI
jgi:hypothetical protein